jgi:hypothetical protein
MEDGMEGWVLNPAKARTALLRMMPVAPVEPVPEINVLQVKRPGLPLAGPGRRE